VASKPSSCFNFILFSQRKQKAIKMRSFIASLILAGAAVTRAQGTIDSCLVSNLIHLRKSFSNPSQTALASVDTSSFSDCTDLSDTDCLCANKDALPAVPDACKTAGIGTSINSLIQFNSNNLKTNKPPDLTSLISAACANTSKGSAAAPARHASKPMELANDKRAYRPSSDDMDMSAPRVVYVTETRTECSCKSTPALNPMHISQIPVDVPMSSSMGAMMAASTPASSNGAMMAASSSVIFGSQMSAATPTPSGASANRFHTFQGAAPKTSAVQGGIAALGVAAVMGLMIAL
jgi:hypothetical protein